MVKTFCPACGTEPCAACLDGNMQLNRLETASKGSILIKIFMFFTCINVNLLKLQSR